MRRLAARCSPPRMRRQTAPRAHDWAGLRRLAARQPLRRVHTYYVRPAVLCVCAQSANDTPDGLPDGLLMYRFLLTFARPAFSKPSWGPIDETALTRAVWDRHARTARVLQLRGVQANRAFWRVTFGQYRVWPNSLWSVFGNTYRIITWLDPRWHTRDAEGPAGEVDALCRCGHPAAARYAELRWRKKWD